MGKSLHGTGLFFDSPHPHCEGIQCRIPVLTLFPLVLSESCSNFIEIPMTDRELLDSCQTKRE